MHVIEERADRERHKDTPLLDCGLGNGSEVRGRQRLDDDIRDISKGRQVHHLRP
jgi:hypothetical protein